MRSGVPHRRALGPWLHDIGRAVFLTLAESKESTNRRTITDKIKTVLWYDNQAEQAANLYTSLFPDSSITNVTKYENAGPSGDVTIVEFELAGREFVAMNAGPEFKFTEAISIMVDCEDQAEVDRYWSALTADGGEESMCGWLKDRWGLSWQIVPKVMNQLLGDPDPGRAGRAMQAMLSMQKLDIAVLQAAADGRS
jgi:predicted 3-demethylubiquinone-9 3-methyltransferase (glyoxalase superfamily)